MSVGGENKNSRIYIERSVMREKQPDTYPDEEAIRRLVRLCEMNQQMLERMTNAERDRILQTHLAEARGPEKNLQVLCEMSDLIRSLRSRAGQ